MSELKLSVPRVVRAGQKFHVYVAIEGASPGAAVRVDVKKAEGPASKWQGGTTRLKTDYTGGGDGVLNGARLEKPGDYVFVASASDEAGDFFAAQATVLEVIE